MIPRVVDQGRTATPLTHLEPTCSSDQTRTSCPRVRGSARSRLTCEEEAVMNGQAWQPQR